MQAFGGFDHNVQTFRVVTKLERRYPALRRPEPDLGDAGGRHQAQRPGHRISWPSPPGAAISEFDAQYGLRLDTWASAEAQVAALADDIAYNNHDVDDGVLAGLFNLDELADVPLIGPHAGERQADYPDVEDRHPAPGGRAADDRGHGRRRPGRDQRRRRGRSAGSRPRTCAPLGHAAGLVLARHGRGPGRAAAAS